ncbi:hypothetical protein [Streptomyces sp. NPDC060194]|uniref:hypothetical protein n=1 Tax=Streptomyces sp. NPDC060194 TaxID=3347069 RepID=UPI00365B3DFA
MDTSKLELAAQRFDDARTALESAQSDLRAEAVAALREEGANEASIAEVSAITGWSPQEINQLAGADSPL